MSCNRVIYSKLGVNSGSKRRLINPEPSTLGEAGLHLHYANLIVVVEKMVSAVNEIDEESRDNLYGMLPWSIRSVVRKRLGDHHGRSGVSPSYDAGVAAGWRHTVGRVMEWLLPLAHNMLRWQAVRNFEREQQEADSKTHVLLVQTLYFADRPKTEAAIVELVVGLDYLYRVGKRLDQVSS
ncbi:Protein PSK SIMULATOR 1 [Linum grandiflorum]